MVPQIKTVKISQASRLRAAMMRIAFKIMMAHMARANETRMTLLQLRAAGALDKEYSGLPAQYRIINNVPGTVLGDLSMVDKPAILYLHGGGFVFPAAPKLQVSLMGRLCADLDAVGFLPDYRLVPHHSAPAALDDCERAYRALLNQGFPAHRIVLVGESAGGNLVLCLLQRIRRMGLPMPACAVPMSPATELARSHALPSRSANAKYDGLVSLPFLYRMIKWYVGANDASAPEISPLYADYTGLPPLYFLASAREVLLDDSVLAAHRAQEAGVDVQLDVWPVLPHAFLLFESLFVEARQARNDIAAFMRHHLLRGESRPNARRNESRSKPLLDVRASRNSAG